MEWERKLQPFLENTIYLNIYQNNVVFLYVQRWENIFTVPLTSTHVPKPPEALRDPISLRSRMPEEQIASLIINIAPS